MNFNQKKFVILFFFLLLFGNLFIWKEILLEERQPSFYFLDVGQGEASLLIFPQSIRILIDAGPQKGLSQILGKYLNYFEKRIDLMILSHPNLDHYFGFFEIIEKFSPRLFIFNGFSSENEIFQNLLSNISQKGIPILVLKAGDRIKIGNNVLEILSPAIDCFNQNFNETSLVIKAKINNFQILFTGDASTEILNSLTNLQADVLKISHHGSRKGTNQKFLELVQPKIALIGAGANNPYHHPHQEVIELLKKVGSSIFRTDLNGTLRIIFGKDLKIIPERNF